MDWATLVPLEELDALTAGPEPEEQSEGTNDTNAVILYKLALDLGVIAFRAQDIDGIFARFPVNGHFEIDGLNSKRFKAWLTNKFFKARLQEPKNADIEGALLLLQSEAWDQPKRKTFVRLARVDGKIYLDMCDDDYRVIEIDSRSWRIVHNPDVWFMRSQSMKSLPEPKQGGSLLDLKEFISLDDEDFVLLVGWLVAACNPEGPFPILTISSEHGSGKSTTTSILKSVIDPDINPRLADFKDADALFSTAASRWLMCYDNLSKLTEEDSNHLCRLATGGGYSKRMLFTDNDSFSCQAKRPLLLNGVHLTLGRMDLLDRAYLIRLRPIPLEKRRMEEDFYAAFDRKHPHILGALLSALSCALRERSYIPKRLPRMADGAAFVMRAEKGGGLPWKPGIFADVLERREREKRDDALMDDTTASKIVELANAGGWTGSLKALLAIILESAPQEEKRFLPNTSRGLSKKLEELAPLLRSAGVRWEKKKYNTGQWITLATVPTDEGDDKGDAKILSSLHRHRANPDEHWLSDDNDDSDDKKPSPYAHGKKSSDTPDSQNPKIFEAEIDTKLVFDRHYRHLRHFPCDSKAPEGDDTVTMESVSSPSSSPRRIPPVGSDLPPWEPPPDEMAEECAMFFFETGEGGADR